MDKLTEGIERLGVAKRTLPLLKKYIGEIELFNPTYRLIRVKERDELIVKHILDSLSGAGLMGRHSGTFIADVGSGAGLPGIPLAIALPDKTFTLIERNGRRAGFLRNVHAILRLPNVVVEEKEVEKSPEGVFDIVTFRAFHPISPELLKILRRLLKSDGVIMAYKGRRDVIVNEMSAIKAEWEMVPIQSPFLDEERHIIVIHNFT
ncbi:MAG: 16S rRNA (guanine(527)-N(7))-methyltransferase RsmG [Treponema sp.]|jgi:16S rRNA (guanine527-N7)-methyltransferase|nr:16S rRNA (guanine(527)-N(7))-methyltransferase RsmG [Treponema sp.]